MSILKKGSLSVDNLVKVVGPISRAAGRLLAICLYMAELLAVVALCKNILSFVRLNLGEVFPFTQRYLSSFYYLFLRRYMFWSYVNLQL
jgi:hypothetical protein